MSRVLPILFNTEMVQAILDGRKTVTRRVAKGIVPFGENGEYYNVFRCGEWAGPLSKEWAILLKAPYKPGDILYVRETFVQTASHIFWYKADDKNFLKNCKAWKPSIHMPKKAARLWLKVTDVKVERLQNMSGQDVLKEGLNSHVHPKADYFDANQREMFENLWDSIIKKSDLDRYGWGANPYVFVIEFERCEKPTRV